MGVLDNRWVRWVAFALLPGCSLVFDGGKYQGRLDGGGPSDGSADSMVHDGAVDAAPDGAVDGATPAKRIVPSYLGNPDLLETGGEDPFADLTAGTYLLDTLAKTLTVCPGGTCDVDPDDGAAIPLTKKKQTGADENFSIAVLSVDGLSVPEDVSIHVVGTQPLAILSKGPISIAGTLDFGAERAQNRAGAGGLPGTESNSPDAPVTCSNDIAIRSLGSGGCGVNVAAGVVNPYQGSSGGGGGGVSVNGDTGADPAWGAIGGAAIFNNPFQVVVYGGNYGRRSVEFAPLFFGGGGGGAGGGWDQALRAPGGHGGGAVLLVSKETILVKSSGDIRAPGGGGGVAQLMGMATMAFGGGGGGGAGGMIVLEAPSVTVEGSLSAHGGGGGGGGMVYSSGGGTPATAGQDGDNQGGAGGTASTEARNSAGGPGGIRGGLRRGTIGATCDAFRCSAGGAGGSAGRIIVHADTFSAPGVVAPDAEEGPLVRKP